MRLATIKLVIDADAFEAEANEPLTDHMLQWCALLVSEQTSALCGCTAIESGWVTCLTTER